MKYKPVPTIVKSIYVINMMQIQLAKEMKVLGYGKNMKQNIGEKSID